MSLTETPPSLLLFLKNGEMEWIRRLIRISMEYFHHEKLWRGLCDVPPPSLGKAKHKLGHRYSASVNVHARRDMHVFLANKSGTYNNCLEVRSFLHLDAAHCILKLWCFPICLNMAYVFLKEVVMIKGANLRRAENTECTLCKLYCSKISEVWWNPTDVIKIPTPISFRLKFNVVS